MNRMTDTCENITFPHTPYAVGNKRIAIRVFSPMLETTVEQCNLPGNETDHASAVFDREGDVVLYGGCGYKVSCMNTQGIPMVLQKLYDFLSYPSMVFNTTEKDNYFITQVSPSVLC